MALNKIDKEATELLLSTEKYCRKLRTGAIAFLPELSKKGLTWRFWRKVVQYKQKRFFDFDYLSRTAKLLDLNFF